PVALMTPRRLNQDHPERRQEPHQHQKEPVRCPVDMQARETIDQETRAKGQCLQRQKSACQTMPTEVSPRAARPRGHVLQRFCPRIFVVAKLTYAAMGSVIDVRWAWRLLIAMVLSVPAVMSTADPDLWGHTRLVLDMLETQRIPPVD